MKKRLHPFSAQTREITSLGLHSASLIAYQLILMQLIAYMQGYHFAYMIISIAMLGFGASGTFLALFRKRLLKSANWLVPVLMSVSTLCMIAAFHLATLPAFRFDVYLLFVDTSQFLKLAGNYLLFFLPFFTGALAIGILFINNARNIGKYYFSNLIGSGIGGLLVLGLLTYFFPIRALAIVAVIPVASALLIFTTDKKMWQTVMAVIALLAVLFSLFSHDRIPVSQYKSLSRTLNLPEARIISKKPGVQGITEVVESPALRYAPALSFTFSGTVPVKKNVFLNAEYYGPLHNFGKKGINIHDYTTEALPYVMADRNKVLIAGAGTGAALAHAQSHGVEHATGVVENRRILKLITEELEKETSYATLPQGIKLIHSDIRQYLFKTEPSGFDAIILPRLESFGGSTGINALQEDYAMTLEAFFQMWDMLAPEGVLVITSWIDYPPRTTLKLALSLMQTLENSEVENPLDHLVAIKSWGTITFALKKTPLHRNEKDNILAFTEQMQFDVVFLPGIDPATLPEYNLLEDESMKENLNTIFSGNYQQLEEEYQFHISPATDDKPYFSRFLKMNTLNELRTIFGAETMPFLELGYLVLWVTLIQSTVLAFVLIVLPLFRLRGDKKSKTPTLLYFGALGIGYMFVEIIFIQRFVLYLGQPVYAITAVISTMMISSGAGSLFSGNFEKPLNASRLATLMITAILLLYTLIFTNILTYTITYPTAIKALIALVLIAVPAFFMGMPFPTGIRLLTENHENQIAWAWGINGCLSVIATSLATLIAVENGFIIVMLLAAVCYLLAFAVFWFYRQVRG